MHPARGRRAVVVRQRLLQNKEGGASWQELWQLPALFQETEWVAPFQSQLKSPTDWLLANPGEVDPAVLKNQE